MRLATAATALALLVACQGDRPVTPTISAPNAAIADGREGSVGNKDFFWLPPVAAQPTGEQFKDHAFNPNLQPYIEIHEIHDIHDPNNPAVVLARTPAVLVPGEELYKLEWSTPAVDGVTYRAFAFLSATPFDGEKELGFVDLEPRDNGVENLSDGTVYEFKEGRVVPLKMRIESHAGCEDPTSSGPCSSETIIGAEGGEVVLSTGDRIVVPPQNAAGVQREFTLTLELCNDDPIDVDLPTFGNCLRATLEPPLTETERFSPFINVLVCSLNPTSDPDFGALSEAQEDFVTLYRQDEENDAVYALPKSVASCPAEPTGGLTRTGWRGLRDRLAAWFLPPSLHAGAVVVNVGGGGDSPFTSKFQLALPAKMEACTSTTCPALSGSAPAVLVTDGASPAQGVSGATVTFEVTGGTISVTDADAVRPGYQVVTGPSGIAALDTWTPGATGTSTVTGSGRAIADAENNGPKAGVDPFMPDISQPGGGTNVDLVNANPILTHIGQVTFTATAAEPVGNTIFQATFSADALDALPGAPAIGSWTTVTESTGMIRVRSAVGDLDNKPVELNQPAAATGGMDLVGTVAGTPPSTGRWVVRWRSLINSADAFYAPIVLRGGSGIIASLEYRSSNQLTYNSATNDIGIDWTQGTSQLFEIVVDLDADVTSLRVNGTAVSGQQNVPFFQAATSLERIGAELGGTSAQIFAWDDIEIRASEGQIAFESNRTGDFDIWVVNPDPANPSPANLSNDPSRDDRDPAWAFDGSKIAFSRDDGVNEDIWVMDRDGANQVRLTTDAARDIWPTWSPDGAKIAWTSKRTGFWEIWVMDANGANQTQLTFDQNPLGNLHPTWSPDGTKIAIHSGRDGGGDAEIVIVDISAGLASPTFTQLTNNSVADLEPVWSPDGSRIAFTRQPASHTDILVIQVATLTESVVAQTSGVEGGPSWSPDGTRLAFMNNGVTGDFEIFTAKLDGTDVQRLTFNVNVDRDPAWR